MRDDFEENGFIILNNVVSIPEMDKMRKLLERLIRFKLKRIGLTAEDPYEGELLHQGYQRILKHSRESAREIYDFFCMTPEFLSVTTSSNIREAVSSILFDRDERPVYCFLPRCRMDPPGVEDRLYGWHQEAFYTIPRSRYVQLWMPLFSDATVQNGSISVLPRSHRDGILPSSWSRQEGIADQILVDESHVHRYEELRVNIKAGDAIIFSGNLIHRSNSNLSDCTRYTALAMYHDLLHERITVPRQRYEFVGETPEAFYEECKNGWNVNI